MLGCNREPRRTWDYMARTLGVAGARPPPSAGSTMGVAGHGGAGHGFFARRSWV